jgi:hypothetical protein
MRLFSIQGKLPRTRFRVVAPAAKKQDRSSQSNNIPRLSRKFQPGCSQRQRID